jgi:hypothetical protein
MSAPGAGKNTKPAGVSRRVFVSAQGVGKRQIAA